MVNEGFLDFFKKSHPPKVETPTPVATKPSEPKVDTPKKNVYADQFVKIFDKLNEMATKNGFKESKRYIEQESGLDSFVNYVVFSKGSRDIRFDYYWDKKRVVGNFGIEVTDSGVDEYKIPQEVSQKEIPTVAKKLFSTKTKNDVVQDNSQKGESFEKYLNRTIDFEKVKQYSTKNGWSTKFVDDKIVEFEKGGDKIVVTIPSVSKLSKKLVSNIEYKGEQYEVLLKNVKLFLATIISGKDVPTQLALSEPNVSFIAPNIQTEPTPEKEPKPKTKSKPKIEDIPKEKVNPKEYYNKLFDFDLIQTTAINKGWKVDVEENKDTNKYDSILFTRGDEDIIVIPHEDKGDVTIETKKGSTNVEFKYVKKVLTDLIKTPLPKSTVTKPKLSPKESFDKMFDFDLVKATAINKGWKVGVVSNEDGGYESITFDRGDDNLIKVIPQPTGDKVLVKTNKGATDVDIKSVKKVLLDLIKTPLPKPEKPKLKQPDYEKLFRFNEVTQIAKQAGWKQTIPVAPSSDTSNKYYAKFTKDNNEILFKPHDKTSGEEGRSSLLVNGKLTFLPYKDVYKKLTTLLNK